MDDTSVIALVREQKTKSQRELGAQYKNTDKCFAFYDADDSTYKDHIQFTDTTGSKKKAEVVFNQIMSNVDAVGGFMAQNRRQAKYIAHVDSEPAQSLYSRYMNSLYSYHREQTNADQLETEQDIDMLVCGYGAIETDLSYIVGNASTNPYGDIIKLKLDPAQVGWDARAKAKNLLDARWAYYFQDHDLKDALELFDSSSPEDFGNPEVEDTDEGYSYNPYGGVYDKIKALDSVEWSSKQEERVRVFNHQWFQYETFYRAENPVFLAETLEDAQYFQLRLEQIASEVKRKNPEFIDVDDLFVLDPTAEEIVFDEATKLVLVSEFGDYINPVNFKRKCFYTAVYSGSHLFTWFKSISQQGFSIKFKTGTYNRTQKIWVGMVNSMIEPQKYYNKSLTELMFTIASNSKGGVMVEESAVEDIKEFEKKYAKTDAVIKVRDGALSQGKIQEKKSPAVPTGLETFVQLSEQAIAKNGVDPSFMGALEREDQSGILYKRRIRQVISKMAKYFDSITLYQKEDARLNADLIRVWVENNAGQFVRITGEDGAEEFVMIGEDNLVAEYDVAIQEAAQTPEDKKETSMMLTQFGDKLATTGNIQAANTFYAESLSFLGIDSDVKNRLIEALQPNQETVPMQVVEQLQAQLQQLQSEQAQLQMAKVKSDIDKNNAETQTKMASINKTQAEIAKTLEEAASTGIENDLMRQAPQSSINVTI